MNLTVDININYMPLPVLISHYLASYFPVFDVLALISLVSLTLIPFLTSNSTIDLYQYSL